MKLVVMHPDNLTIRIKQAALELSGHVDFRLAPTALYYDAAVPDGALKPPPGSWTCMFSFMKQIQKGGAASFCKDAPGCAGAISYLGFGQLPALPAALYLAGKERLKRDAALAASFYMEVKPQPAREQYLIFRRLEDVSGEAGVDVVNLWVSPSSLSILHTLANYDRATNDNVIMPFASGCQSIWTLPYKEGMKEQPRAVAGALDPTVRRFLPDDTMSFSVPAGRFLEMCANIPGSFISP